VTSLAPAVPDGAGGAGERAEAARREEALRDLRRFRRRRWLANLDWVDALYRAYLTALALGALVVGLSAAAQDAEVGPATADRVADRGPAWLGLALATAVAAGLRSGGRGGPLALEAAEVRHVLLAPLDRRLALRPPAWRILRFAAFVGVVAGAAAGQYAYRRLPGDVAGWVIAGICWGLLLVTGFVAAALVASGGRLGRSTVGVAALAVLGWSVLDIAADVTSSPWTLAGGLGLWPLRVRAEELLGVIPFAALAVVGWRRLGGISVERAERRSALVGQLRFAVTLQDVRTVVLLRRQLTQEHGRRRPWVRIGGLSARPGHLPTWRRSWQGLARWPAVRFARLAVLGAAAGLSLVAVWDGTTALVVVAGAALWLAALDAIEPLAQDADHPTLVDSCPVEPARQRIRQLAVPVIVMTAVGLIGCAAALATGHPGLVLRVGLPTVVPAALVATCGAAVSVVRGGLHTGMSDVLQPELAGVRQITAAVTPPGLAVLGGAPVLVARHAVGDDVSALRGALAGCVIPLAASLLALVYLRFRERTRAWWNRNLELAAHPFSVREKAREEAAARIAARDAARARTAARRRGGDAEDDTDDAVEAADGSDSRRHDRDDRADAS
jgi:hypothetical protein